MLDLGGLGLHFDGEQQARLLGDLLLLDLVRPGAGGCSWVGEVGQGHRDLGFQLLPAVDHLGPVLIAVAGNDQVRVTLNQVVDLDRAPTSCLSAAFTT
ncbi:hypothetical protein D3C80_1751000 [compost metagenome]